VTSADVADALGLSPDVEAKTKVLGRNALGDLFAVLPDAAALLGAVADSAKVAALGGRGLCASAPGGVAAREGGAPCDFTSRFWGPNIGIEEDPVTGSSFCGLAPYWKARLKRKGGEEMIAYQASERGGTVRVACVKHKAPDEEGEDEVKVHVRGRATSVFKGEILTDGFQHEEEPER